ncbi:MAG: TlpA family protein disulfide reductase [Saprospiraceae bacterium]|jgi:thiol-disulfide isomerase/thioredoxin|nr:TlpA family protein disulfide reductase [Saprospiraceae bacterium]
MKYKIILFLGALAFSAYFLQGCFVMDGHFTKLPPGAWRAVLKLTPEFISPNPKGQPLPDKVNMKFADVNQFELPFNFEVVYENDTTFHIDIINGDERITVPATDIAFGRSKHRSQDTILIKFPMYESYIRAAFMGNTIEGQWVVTTKENYTIPFVAKQGEDWRFTTLRKQPALDLSGDWACTFGLESFPEAEEPYPAIGEFKQVGNRLTGTFLTETGDYRFLEGTVQEDKFYLSCFDGSHAFLFHGKILPDGTLTGAFFSGKHYRTTWSGKRKDASFKLADPDSLTFLNPGFEKFSFSFQNPDGKVISLDNPEYKGKAKIIQIMGTWCPNCRDETEFLVNFLKEKNPQNLAVIALAFEKHADKPSADRAIRTYKERFAMPYEMVYAGTSKKADAAKSLPMLKEVFAYPTLLFLDENDRVVKIHTGFSGPATSGYSSFKEKFNKFVAELI